MTSEPSDPNKPKMGILPLAAVLGAAIIGVGIYLTAPSAVNVTPEDGSAPKSGSRSGTAALNTGAVKAFVYKAAPEALEEVTFIDESEKPVKLADFKGKAVLLNVWATWCAPCRHEMPALDRLQAKLAGKPFEVVALSVDRSGAAGSREFLDEIGAKNLKLYVDPTTRASKPLKVIGMPTTLLIDAEGREVGRLIGPAEWDTEEAVKLITSVIDGEGGGA